LIAWHPLCGTLLAVVTIVTRKPILISHTGGSIMNWDQIKGNWKQLTGQAKQQWGKLTDDDLAQVDGRREELIGRVQERYGLVKEEAEKQVAKFENCCNC
jgi:uncharacterized protein YjbJ (UPF0337 family)